MYFELLRRKDELLRELECINNMIPFALEISKIGDTPIPIFSKEDQAQLKNKVKHMIYTYVKENMGTTSLEIVWYLEKEGITAEAIGSKGLNFTVASILSGNVRYVEFTRDDHAFRWRLRTPEEHVVCNTTKQKLREKKGYCPSLNDIRAALNEI